MLTRLCFPFFLLFSLLFSPAWGKDDGRQPVVKNGYTIFAAGDIADCRKTSAENSAARKTSDLVFDGLAKTDNHAVLMLGDATYPKGRPWEFSNCYAPTWGRFKDKTWPVPGNHEYLTPFAFGYFSYFEGAARPAGKSWYSFRLGKWRLFALNSNLRGEDHQEQLAWLKKQLAGNDAPCVLAYWHHAVFSSGDHGNDTKMMDAWQVLHDAKADVVLAAHDHRYERFVPLDREGNPAAENGLPQFVVGTGGGRLRKEGHRQPGSAAHADGIYGVLRMELLDDGYTWEFLPAAGANYRDAGSGICKPKH